MERLTDRKEAGERLARQLTDYAGRDDTLVLALPRGGVPVAFEIAAALRLPLDVLIVRKLGAPGRPELAMGAIASGGVRIVNAGIVDNLAISDEQLDEVTGRERIELERRERVYRGDRPPLAIAGRTVILVDDGVATGATMRAAVAAVRALEPARLIVAVPTAASDSLLALQREADEVVCLGTPEPYIAVGAWYRNFPQVGDAEVRELLAALPAVATTDADPPADRADEDATRELP